MIGWDGLSQSHLWEFDADLDIDYPNDNAIIDGDMFPTSLLISDVDSSGLQRVFITARHTQYYPTVLLELDADSGYVRQRYDHAGDIAALVARDINADGRQELVFGGTHNGYLMAIFGVLDADNISGRGLGEGNYQVGEGPTHHEILYGRWKKSPLATFSPNPYPTIDKIKNHDNNDQGSLTFFVKGAIQSTASGIRTAAMFHYTLDLSLKPLSIGTNSIFDNLWRMAQLEGFIDIPLDNDSRQSMLDLAEIWTPEGWKRMVDVGDPLNPSTIN